MVEGQGSPNRTPPQCTAPARSAAASTGHTERRAATQRLSRTSIDLIGHGIELLLRVDAQIRAPGKALMQQPAGVLLAASWPRTARLAKVRAFMPVPQRLVTSHLLAPVTAQALSHWSGHAACRRRLAARSCGRVGAQQLNQQRTQGVARPTQAPMARVLRAPSMRSPSRSPFQWPGRWRSWTLGGRTWMLSRLLICPRLSCLLERGQRVARAVRRGPLRRQASKAFLRAPPGCAHSGRS